jgi:MFS family permease
MTAPPAPFLATRRGRLTLLLLCAVQFLDVADSSIMNVALPSVRRDLGFSAQGLQWVLSGYLVTYGGLLLLGGRARGPARPTAPASGGHRDFRGVLAGRRPRGQR